MFILKNIYKYKLLIGETKTFDNFLPFPKVIQRRQNGDINFYRNWKDYKNEFGHADGEYWFGRSQITFSYFVFLSTAK